MAKWEVVRETVAVGQQLGITKASSERQIQNGIDGKWAVNQPAGSEQSTANWKLR